MDERRFSKRHYEMLAAQFRAVGMRSTGVWDPEILALLPEDVADMLQDDSMKFDRERFLRACQPEEE